MRRFLALSASQYLLLATQLITGPLLARALGPNDRGILATVLVVYMMCAIIVGLGSQASFRRLVSMRSDPKQAYAYLYRWTAVSTMFSLLISAFVFYVIAGSEIFLAVAIAGLLLTSGLANYRNSVVSGALSLGELGFVSRNSSVIGIVTLVGVVLFFFLGILTIEWSIFVYLLATLFSTALCLRPLNWRIKSVDTRPNFLYSLTSIPGQLGETTLVRIDQLLLPLLLGFQAAGYYAVAFSYAYLIYPLLHSMAIHSAAGVSSDSYREIFSGRKIFRLLTAAVICPLIAGFAAKPVITLLFGGEFAPSIEISYVLLLSTSIMGVSVAFMQMNNTEGRSYHNSISSLVGAIIAVGASIFLAPIHGIMGIAWGSVLGVFSHLCIQMYFRFRRKNDNPVFVN